MYELIAILLLLFFCGYPAMGIRPLLLEYHDQDQQQSGGRCRVLWNESTDGFERVDLGKAFQLVIVLGKNENL